MGTILTVTGVAVLLAGIVNFINWLRALKRNGIRILWCATGLDMLARITAWGKSKLRSWLPRRKNAVAVR